MGEGRGHVKCKKTFVQKIACTPRNPNTYQCTGPKKNSHKGNVNEKNSCGLKIPHPTLPHNFFNGPLLNGLTEDVSKYQSLSKIVSFRTIQGLSLRFHVGGYMP